MSRTYRDEIKNLECTYDDIISDELYRDKSFVELSDVIGTIDAIESDINQIIAMLEDIEGLTEIDEAKAKLKELSYNVY